MTDRAAIVARDLAKSSTAGRPWTASISTWRPARSSASWAQRRRQDHDHPHAGRADRADRGDAWIDGLALGHADSAIRAARGPADRNARPLRSAHRAAKPDLLRPALRRARCGPPGIEFYLRRLDLWERRDDRVAGFSKGMKQKVALTRALLHRPGVVFLDEPTAGLDPESARVVHEFIDEIRGEGRTIFLCTHNLDEAQRLCDRVAIFRRRIIRMGSPTELRRSLYGRQVEVRLADRRRSPSRCSRRRAGLPICTVDARSRRRRPAGDHACRTWTRRCRPWSRRSVGAGAQISRVAEVEHSLQSAYFDLIGREWSQPAPAGAYIHGSASGSWSKKSSRRLLRNRMTLCHHRADHPAARGPAAGVGLWHGPERLADQSGNAAP